jgi:hypothetical protein
MREDGSDPFVVVGGSDTPLQTNVQAVPSFFCPRKVQGRCGALRSSQSGSIECIVSDRKVLSHCGYELRTLVVFFKGA